MSKPPFATSELTLEPEDIGTDNWQAMDVGTEAPHPRGNVPGQEKKAGEAWDSTAWTNEILRQETVQISKAKLDRRLEEFLELAKPEERRAYEASRSSVLKMIHQAKEAHDSKYPAKTPESDRAFADMVKRGFRAASETAYEYTKVMDVLVGQAPEYVALTYGAVKLLLVVQVNYEEMKKNVEEYMITIKTKFSMIDHLTTYFPRARLVETIGRLLEAFQRFLAKALKLYARNRFVNTLRAMTRPWKGLEPVVQSIERTYEEIIHITQLHSHFTGQVVLAKVSQILELIEGESIKFSKPSDIEQTSDLFRRWIEAQIEQHCVDSKETTDDYIDRELPAGLSNESCDLDGQLAAMFTELNEFDEARMQQQKIAEQLPEMRQHRSTQRNILKVEKVMDWIESETSRLLWIDGNNILQRETFGISFVSPLLIFGESNFETCVVLRHFCGNRQSIKPSNYRVLIQDFLRQLLKQRPEISEELSGNLKGANLSDIRLLWGLFTKCLKSAEAPCTFIIIDSIDFLVSGNSEGRDEREFVLKELNDLVNDTSSLIKILLTASLSQDTQSASVAYSSALMPQSSVVRYPPERKLSMASIEDDLSLVSHKLVEIQERKCKVIQFAELPMIYLVNSTIYTREDGSLRAFVISELSGMEPISPTAYRPLIIRAWAVGHNGKCFVRCFYDLKIPQFVREMDITDLKYTPAGYLPKEHLYRRQLIERGRRYWELGSKVHWLDCRTATRSRRIIVDQQLQPARERQLQELDVELRHVPQSHLKPLTALTCPPKIPAYCLDDNIWGEFDVDTLQSTQYHPETMERLYLPAESKDIVINVIQSYAKPGHTPSFPTLFLLHGGPGVGKTTTAKYSAEFIKRPIICISSADTVKDTLKADQALKAILSQAERWGAVLLLEHVDLIFLRRRKERSGQDDNLALLLRTLETHCGLVFLTTDRPGIIDDSVFSRITMSLELGLLNNDAKKGILMDLAKDHGMIIEVRPIIDNWEELDTEEFSGWELRNAFESALEGPDFERRLRLAIKSRVQLRQYMQELRGYSSEDYAYQEITRLGLLSKAADLRSKLSDEGRFVAPASVWQQKLTPPNPHKYYGPFK
ncbi:hypothetical protein NA57DRAFT_77539 [Rhizodiscina lignyota]|uniref:AAA+ ATPase domain-containing protein n=1 Tax=Rhizodiscina lignyota TaxID=1504668 RepID=A0A9P4M4Y4_9PEZI|nr:hypothetical protein NA57DRAFT_77539 [Rhizodiscina lignyota]